jgi:hypothetical protein
MRLVRNRSWRRIERAVQFRWVDVEALCVALDQCEAGGQRLTPPSKRFQLSIFCLEAIRGVTARPLGLRQPTAVLTGRCLCNQVKEVVFLDRGAMDASASAYRVKVDWVLPWLSRLSSRDVVQDQSANALRL